ncbi:hypothetical protein Scep_018218 [Stephania cephalantha]|uniref:Secreted protein n=1 Tax=Stephania cephalantha TaxID=152367 RepID=A0AAP0IRK9_9MAGN
MQIHYLLLQFITSAAAAVITVAANPAVTTSHRQHRWPPSSSLSARSGPEREREGRLIVGIEGLINLDQTSNEKCMWRL